MKSLLVIPVCVLLGLLSACGRTAHDGSGPNASTYFAVLRSTPETVPRSVRPVLAKLPRSYRAGLDLEQAQYLRTRRGGFWLFIGPDGACLLTQSGSNACGATAEFVKHGQSLGEFDPPKSSSGDPTDFRVFGVVPDWVRAVQAKIGERERRFPVQGNTYSLSAPSPIVITKLVKAAAKDPQGTKKGGPEAALSR